MLDVHRLDSLCGSREQGNGFIFVLAKHYLIRAVKAEQNQPVLHQACHRGQKKGNVLYSKTHGCATSKSF